MLAGRKLLLADDSITIQKVVDLTFADEGIQVISVNNGAEAIEKLEEFSPDVVLADVFMPEVDGYTVCEYIKHNERLKHIPVMLLVGSFEPFDEAEARRVGADDILTKPFQSIRNLIDKVGALLSGQKATEGGETASLNPPGAETIKEFSVADQGEVTTAELPKPETIAEGPETMDTDELELTTADTQQLTPEMLAETQPIALPEDRTKKMSEDEAKMKTESRSVTEFAHASALDYGDVLLDLGDFEPTVVRAPDDAILDIDLDAPVPRSFPSIRAQATVAVESKVESLPGVEKEAAWAFQDQDTLEWAVVSESSAVEIVEPAVVEETAPASGSIATETAVAVEEMQKPPQISSPAEIESEPRPVTSALPAGQITLAQLSPEVIDAVARRAVEQLSEKVLQEIAWEVVPQLAELLIKQQLEEEESKAK